MIHQQAINHIEFAKNPARQLIQTFEYDKKVPFFGKRNQIYILKI